MFNPNWLTFREANYQAVLGYNLEDFSAVIANLETGMYGAATTAISWCEVVAN